MRKLAERTERPWLQLLALYAIEHDEVSTQAALAERLQVDAPAMSRLAAALERDGSIRRVEGADRRCVRFRVTAKAKRDVKVFEQGLRWLDAEAARHLSARDLAALMKLMTRLQAGIADTTGASADRPRGAKER